MRCRPTTSRITVLVSLTVSLGLLASAGLSDAMATDVPASIALTSAKSRPALLEQGGKLLQPIRLVIQRVGSPVEATIRVDSQPLAPVTLTTGANEIEVNVAAVDRPTEATVEISAADSATATQKLVLKPVRKWTLYLLPHSHVDIGYTHVQTEVERAQWQYLEMAMDAAQKSAGNPPASRFKWNAEVLWAVDSYLKQATPERRQAFLDAVKQGQIGLDALYGNQLTGLCRPEELLRLVSFATRVSKETGVPIESAMITDVPGYTWGIVTAFSQAGVKYFSVAPNATDRIGRTTSTWGNKPFWWLAPNGRDRVLVWLTGNGYYQVFLAPQKMLDYVEQLEEQQYPYDMVHVRHCRGDNAEPDTKFADMVKQWNESHVSPKLVIATTVQMFRDFEARYGDQIPTMRGDFTPYWEDGAASSARETAATRTAAERLLQAETLWAMIDPRSYPADRFDAAWRNVILYNEHTWGAYNSVSKPDLPFVHQQWAIKQAFALDGDAQSRTLLDAATSARTAEQVATSAVDVFNTANWPRTDLVVLSQQASRAGDRVLDAANQPVPSQRLSTGELAFLAQNIPPLAGKRFSIVAGEPATQGQASASAAMLSTPAVSLVIDPATGAIVSLRGRDIPQNLSDTSTGIGLNRFYYVLGDKVQEARSTGPAKVTVKEQGPLVASLQIESDAPGCEKFRREVRVVDGLDRVDLINLIDKKAVREKEAIHLGFAFHVPQGTMRMDLAWAVIQPEVDQLPGGCRNWLTAGRWVDVSNQDYGVTWATLDAPLVEVGAMTANIMGPLTKPEGWLARLEPSQTLYSWAMNNHWYTNYRAEQDGPTTFRYALRPHKAYDAAAAQRFGIECSQPLVAVPARAAAPEGRPLLELDTQDVIVASVKPSADGKALIVRLFGAAGKDATVNLRWGSRQPKAVFLSDLSETAGKPVDGPIPVTGWSLVTLRAELPY